MSLGAWKRCSVCNRKLHMNSKDYLCMKCMVIKRRKERREAQR